MISTQSKQVIKVSKFISNFFNPLTSLFLFFIYYSVTHNSLKETFNKFLPLFLILVLPISLWIFWNVKTEKYTNMDVSNREQRKSLYVFIFIALVIYLFVDYLINRKLDLAMLFLTILLIIMQLSNFFIKSSMHTAFNIYVSALFFTQSWDLGFLWLIISIIVGISRIILKKHSPKEVLSGAIISILVSFAYLYVTFQMQFKI